MPWDLNNAKLVYWRTNARHGEPTWRYAIPTYTLYDPATIGVAAGKSARYGVDAHPPFVVLFQRALGRARRSGTGSSTRWRRCSTASSPRRRPTRAIDALHALIEPAAAPATRGFRPDARTAARRCVS